MQLLGKVTVDGSQVFGEAMQWHAGFSAHENRFNGLCPFLTIFLWKGTVWRNLKGLILELHSHLFLLSVVASYLWLIKYSSYWKRVELESRQRAGKKRFPCKSSSPSTRTHIKFPELPYHASQNAQKGMSIWNWYFTEKMCFEFCFNIQLAEWRIVDFSAW